MMPAGRCGCHFILVQNRCPYSENASRFVVAVRPEWLVGSFQLIDDHGQTVWKSGGDGLDLTAYGRSVI